MRHVAPQCPSAWQGWLALWDPASFGRMIAEIQTQLGVIRTGIALSCVHFWLGSASVEGAQLWGVRSPLNKVVADRSCLGEDHFLLNLLFSPM